MKERIHVETDRAVLYRFYDDDGTLLLDADGYPKGRIEYKQHVRAPQPGITAHTSARTVGWAPFIAGAAGGLLLEGLARLFA